MSAKILIISDTHNDLSTLETIAGTESFDMVYHLGDAQGDDNKIKQIVNVPVEMVRGNCDIFSKLPDDRLIPLGKHKILLTHGHLHGVKRDIYSLVLNAKSRGADYAFYGHTHYPSIQKIDGIVVANPGSLAYPRGGGGPSYMILSIDENGEITLTQKYL